MSVAVKMRRIEIAIRSGTKRKLFLVSEEKAHAIETLLKESHQEGGDELVDIGEVFPCQKDRKRIQDRLSAVSINECSYSLESANSPQPSSSSGMVS